MTPSCLTISVIPSADPWAASGRAGAWLGRERGAPSFAAVEPRTVQALATRQDPSSLSVRGRNNPAHPLPAPGSPPKHPRCRHHPIHNAEKTLFPLFPRLPLRALSGSSLWLPAVSPVCGWCCTTVFGEVSVTLRDAPGLPRRLHALSPFLPSLPVVPV